MFRETKNEIKEQLLFLMNQELPLDGGYRRYGFTLQFKREKNYQSLLISLDDVQYFQALQMEYLGDALTTIHHNENHHAVIFKELERELILYAKKLFIDNPLGELSTSARYLQTFEEDYDKLLFSINQFMEQLEKETAWLSVESLHQLNETFPKDLKALSTVYRTVQDKEEVRMDVEEALFAIQQKLEDFVDEAERNKKLQIKKTKQVIQKR